MKLSKNGLDMIKNFEGFRGTAYKALPSERYFTIGFGHYGPHVQEGDTITKKQAETLLKTDVNNFVDCVDKSVKVHLNQNQFDALVSFCYNVGETAFKASTLLKKLNDGDFKGASDEFLLWVHASGKVLEGLILRREKEKALFDTPAKVVKPSPTKDYMVLKGDTLSEIALKNGTTVKGLLLLNPEIKDPDKIYVGQVIKVPDHDFPQIVYIPYVVKEGDTLIELANKYHTTVNEIMKWNPQIKDRDIIITGQHLKIPKH